MIYIFHSIFLLTITTIYAAPSSIIPKALNTANVQKISPKQLLVPFLFLFNDKKRQQQQNNNKAFEYEISSKECSTLALHEAPTLSFIDEEPPRIITNTKTSHSFKCKKIFECKVFSSPPEANTYWYRNNKLIKVTTLLDLTLNTISTTNKNVKPQFNLMVDDSKALPIIGSSQMTHRLCLDSYLLSSKDNVFKCRIQSVCEPKIFLESKPMAVKLYNDVKQILNYDTNNLGNKKNIDGFYLLSSNAVPIFQNDLTPKIKRKSESAPLITTITSTRLELAGRVVQLACHASGWPRPRIEWSVLNDEDERLSNPIKFYPFIWEMPNKDLLVDTGKTDAASVSLGCKATNELGYDADTSTLILLKEE